MKKLLILFFVAGLFWNCNNNNPFNGDKKNADREGRDEKKTRNNDYDDYDGGGSNESNWTNKQRNKWVNDCIDELNNNPQAKQICDCVLEKMERKYPDAREAEGVSAAEGEKWGRE